MTGFVPQTVHPDRKMEKGYSLTEIGSLLSQIGNVHKTHF